MSCKAEEMESIRQKQISKIIQVALSEIFLKEAKEILGSALVSVAAVKITPDLYIARVYLSIYNTPDPKEILGFIEHNNKEIRGLLGKKIRNKVRTIPQLEFFRDDTMDEVIKLDNLFKEIKAQDDAIGEIRRSSNFKDENPYKDETLNK